MSKHTLAEVNALATKLSGAVKYEDGKFTVDASVYKDHLPENVSYDVLLAAQEHNAVFFPAITKAVGEHAIQAYVDNSAIEEITAVIPTVGSDSFSVITQRSANFRVPKTGESVTKYMPTRCVQTVRATDGTHGLMAAVRDELNTAAAKAFGK